MTDDKIKIARKSTDVVTIDQIAEAVARLAYEKLTEKLANDGWVNQVSGDALSPSAADERK